MLAIQKKPMVSMGFFLWLERRVNVFAGQVELGTGVVLKPT
jgi:hypothetical protein